MVIALQISTVKSIVNPSQNLIEVSLIRKLLPGVFLYPSEKILYECFKTKYYTIFFPFRHIFFLF